MMVEAAPESAGAAQAAGWPRAAAAQEGRLRRWGRRAVSVGLYTVLGTFVLGLLPVLLVAAAVADAVRGTPWLLVRAVLFFAFYLACELVGVVASGVVWLASGGPWGGGMAPEVLDRNFRLQCWWARTLWAGAVRLFRLDVRVDDSGADLGRGPYLLFIRHASVGDTVLAAVYVSDRYGMRLRYVLKHSLLWDPCLDIVGNRLPNYFVRRGSGDTAREVAGVQELLRGLGPRDGVLIYPEGTRFTPQKRRRALERLSRSPQRALYERALGFRNVLPPRLGGPVGLLERNPGADVVFCAHVGFEGTESFRELLTADLVGRRIEVRFWRVPFAAIPEGRAAQVDWLYDRWAEVDAWVGARQGGGRAAGPDSAHAPRHS